MAAKLERGEKKFNKVIEAQNTIVDAVSGATVTTKAYLKAIESALNNQQGGTKLILLFR
ncbi:FMN-binding protein [Lutispora sp.]|uniref:FMN-binding protein n=1 Tax=Lutispora sp. TaxID=2828727 RepID=UPI003564925B